MSLQNKLYETHDIALASYLYCSGVEFVSIDRQNPRRCIFIFKSPDPKLLSKWKAGEADVNALAYHNSYQFLKTQIFEGGNSANRR